jgi:DNA-binding response OmpR family regulator
MNKILVVDDDRELRSNLREILSGAGYQVDEAASGREAVDKSTAGDFDIILLDLIMPRMSGADVLMELRKVAPRSRVIMITAFATIENAVDAIKRGASDYISKPFKIDELITRIRRVLEEASFEKCGAAGDLNCILSSLSNPIRRKIIQLISSRKHMRLMELARELDIDDHTKVIFHLKILKESGILAQEKDKSYSLTKEGEKTVDCLKTLENYLST